MRFIIDNGHRASDAMQYLSQLPGGKWQVDVKPYKPNRSNSQNNLYWMWLGVLGSYMGEHKDALHKKFAVKFLGVEREEIPYVNEAGEAVTETLISPKSTKDLKVDEFTAYLEKIEMTVISAFPEFSLPYPDDYKLAMGGS